MKALFEYIKARIITRLSEGGVPVFKTVRMWNNQFLHSNQKYENEADRKAKTYSSGYRNEKAFPYPACFVEFIVQESDNRAMGIVDYVLTVRFRFGIESYKFERLESFDFCDAFRAEIQLMAPTEASGLTFTTFQEIQTEFDEDFNNVETPYIDYRTRFRSIAAYQRLNNVLGGPIEVNVVAQIVKGFGINDAVLFYEPSEDGLLFREQVENIPVYFYEGWPTLYPLVIGDNIAASIDIDGNPVVLFVNINATAPYFLMNYTLEAAQAQVTGGASETPYTVLAIVPGEEMAINQNLSAQYLATFGMGSLISGNFIPLRIVGNDYFGRSTVLAQAIIELSGA